MNASVVLGAHDTTTWEPTQQTYNISVRSIKTFEGWQYGDLEGDVALIRLPTKVAFNGTSFSTSKRSILYTSGVLINAAYIKPARLPYADDPSFAGETVIITGWGNYSSVSTLSRIPLKCTVRV